MMIASIVIAITFGCYGRSRADRDRGYSAPSLSKRARTEFKEQVSASADQVGRDKASRQRKCLDPKFRMCRVISLRSLRNILPIRTDSINEQVAELRQLVGYGTSDSLPRTRLTSISTSIDKTHGQVLDTNAVRTAEER
jgi:hypothetical protein